MSEGLVERMRAKADAEGLPKNHVLRTNAAALEEALKGYVSDPQTTSVPRMVGTWAKARRIWCEYTGEDLI
jgi:hypothetical protein